MKTKLNSVLLIDDDDASNFINKMLIDRAGITNHVETTLNGQEALQYLTNTGKYEKAGTVHPLPALILLDVNMPIMDGWEFLEAYHNLSLHEKGGIIIVMLTTSFNPDDRIKGEAIAAIAEFRSKPLTLEILNEIVALYFPE